MLSRIKKIRLSKYDRIWSQLVRERDRRCLYCGKRDYLAAHHFIRRGMKSTRLELDNGITLCPAHHKFNHQFSAHRTPEAFNRWFSETYPDRARAMTKKAQLMMTERQAIRELLLPLRQRTSRSSLRRSTCATVTKDLRSGSCCRRRGSFRRCLALSQSASRSSS